MNKLVQKKAYKKLHDKYAICPIDSTIITLTSKLLWVLGYHQVKLFSSLNLSTGSPEDNLINFGHNHDYKFGSSMMSNLPQDAVGVMDRGFAGRLLPLFRLRGVSGLHKFNRMGRVTRPMGVLGFMLQPNLRLSSGV
ncbi:Transposase, IS4 protein [Cylindrospermopsis raciborskii CS-505]|uniref:Uncharacterized protein n=1 Tax=Cylindrospermopsis raciborskii CS-505 TaxID=533240 RepID=A0A853MDR4_9CYAN|nr:Transposase, IS4 protein [Cylindrospermopsis raciborskii CS-505]OBU75436.1 hypothetical protein A9P98_03230 [Cylindrospermopsis raciborskii CS-505]